MESKTKCTRTPETEVEINKSVVPIPKAEAELLLEPEPINRPISVHESESVYELPYCTNIQIFATKNKEILLAHAPSRGGFSMSNSR